MSDTCEMIERLLESLADLMEAEEFAEKAKLEDDLTAIRQAQATLSGIADKYFEECKELFAKTHRRIEVMKQFKLRTSKP
jgi:hypothetical protein